MHPAIHDAPAAAHRAARHTGGTVPICAGRLPSIESELAIDDRSCITVERLSAPAPGLPLAPRLGINAPALALLPKPQPAVTDITRSPKIA